MGGTGAGNPLIAARADSTQWYSGIGAAESVADLMSGFESGSWIDQAIGGFGASMEALALVTDPLGTLVSYGVAWLIEHCKPLSDALDWLAGDPDQITAYAQTWHNVAGAVNEAAAALGQSVTRDVADWSGAAADAYRQHVGEQRSVLDAITQAAEGIGKIVQGAGMLVSLVREIVRDLIAEFVSILVVRVWEWIAEAAGTLGLATPWVIAQVSALVAKWAAKIARVLRALVSTVRKLRPILRNLGDIIASLKAVLRRLAARPSGDFTPQSGVTVRNVHAPPPNAPGGSGPPARTPDPSVEWPPDVGPSTSLASTSHSATSGGVDGGHTSPGSGAVRAADAGDSSVAGRPGRHSSSGVPAPSNPDSPTTNRPTATTAAAGAGGSSPGQSAGTGQHGQTSHGTPDTRSRMDQALDPHGLHSSNARTGTGASTPGRGDGHPGDGAGKGTGPGDGRGPDRDPDGPHHPEDGPEGVGDGASTPTADGPVYETTPLADHWRASIYRATTSGPIATSSTSMLRGERDSISPCATVCSLVPMVFPSIPPAVLRTGPTAVGQYSRWTTTEIFTPRMTTGPAIFTTRVFLPVNPLLGRENYRFPTVGSR